MVEYEGDVMKRKTRSFFAEKSRNNEPQWVPLDMDATINLAHCSLIILSIVSTSRLQMARTPRKARNPGGYNGISSPPPVNTPPQMQNNESGEITAWSSRSPHGLKFKKMYEDGYFVNKTATQIRAEFGDPFSQYATKTINSALQNCRRVEKNEVKAKSQRGTASKLLFDCKCLLLIILHSF